MLRAMDTLGEVGLVVSGHAGPLRLDRAELAAPRHQLEQRLETRAAARDRAGLERAARLAVKEHKKLQRWLKQREHTQQSTGPYRSCAALLEISKTLR